MTFNAAFLCASTGFLQNLATARTTHAMSGRIIVAVHMRAPAACRYENIDIFFSSGVCGSSAF